MRLFAALSKMLVPQVLSQLRGFAVKVMNHRDEPVRAVKETIEQHFPGIKVTKMALVDGRARGLATVLHLEAENKPIFNRGGVDDTRYFCVVTPDQVSIKCEQNHRHDPLNRHSETITAKRTQLEAEPKKITWQEDDASNTLLDSLRRGYRALFSARSEFIRQTQDPSSYLPVRMPGREY